MFVETSKPIVTHNEKHPVGKLTVKLIKVCGRPVPIGIAVRKRYRPIRPNAWPAGQAFKNNLQALACGSGPLADYDWSGKIRTAVVTVVVGAVMLVSTTQAQVRHTHAPNPFPPLVYQTPDPTGGFVWPTPNTKRHHQRTRTGQKRAAVQMQKNYDQRMRTLERTVDGLRRELETMKKGN